MGLRAPARFALINNRTSGENIVRGYYAPATAAYYAEARIEGMNMSLLDPILAV